MRIQLPVLLASLGLGACAGRPAAPPAAAAPAPKLVALQPNAAEPSPRETLAEADVAYLSQLGATRGGRFDTERQIAVLARAVELYTQFLERAAGHPELAAAVRKSQERIADARETIIFLESSLRDAEREGR